MRNNREDLLIPDDAVPDDPTPPGLPRWMRFGLAAGSAAIALGGFGGVAFADDNESPATADSPATVSPQTVSPATVESPATVDTVATADNADTADALATVDVATVDTAATANTVATIDTPTVTTPETTPTVSPATATVTASTATLSPTNTNATLGGLILGLFVSHGLTEDQWASLSATLGMDQEVVSAMTLGELIRASRAAGLTTHDLVLSVL